MESAEVQRSSKCQRAGIRKWRISLDASNWYHAVEGVVTSLTGTSAAFGGNWELGFQMRPEHGNDCPCIEHIISATLLLHLSGLQKKER